MQMLTSLTIAIWISSGSAVQATDGPAGYRFLPFPN
jgi:hypothetical protein